MKSGRAYFSDVLITERTIGYAHQIFHQDVIAQCFPAQGIIQSHISTRRSVQDGSCPVDSKSARVGINLLPDCPDPIDHAMVKIECWITRRCEEVSSDSTKCEVTTAMDTEI